MKGFSLPHTFLSAALGCSLLLCIDICRAESTIESAQPTWQELDTQGFAEAKQLHMIFQQANGHLDFAAAKLAIDKLVDPAIDIPTTLHQIDSIVTTIRSMQGDNPSDNAKLDAIRRYLYEPGPWNENRVYSYDFDDPMGTAIPNKLLPNYLRSRKGNCVSMPLLLIILGQRMGLEITSSRAPLHIFAKYTDRQSGKTINLEATSGGKPMRDEWMRQQNPVSDTALANGIYMRPLRAKEAIGQMAMVLAEFYSGNQQYKKAITISDIILKNDPKNVESMVRKGFCFSQLLKKEFVNKYRMMSDIPVDQRSYFTYLAENTESWYNQAEALGFVRPTQKQDQEYQRRVSTTKINPQ